MPEIKKLSQELIGQIAAGEVVERPASVVKELVENAIDAEATHVTVELRGGGIEYIRISDNGKGIPPEQLRMAFERHATSKLQAPDQLFNIHTLGFRGEALASVAAVAKVTCTTKTADADFGARCVVEGGAFADIRQAASPVGTTFVVEDLFYNTPVRRKFLKKPALEAALVSDYMLRLILSHPEVGFRFVSQGKTVYHSMGDGKIDSALFCLYGKDALKSMRPVGGSMNGLLLEGYVGVGELARGNRQQQSFFINGRYFRSDPISRALENGCQGRVMIGKFPMCALFLTLPYHSVDVNVHPNKLEVRFEHEAAVAEAVQTLVAEAMNAETLGESLLTSGNRCMAEAAATDIHSQGFTVVSLNGEAKDGAGQPPEGGRPSEKAPADSARQAAEPAPTAQCSSAALSKEDGLLEPSAGPTPPQPVAFPTPARPSPVLHETVVPPHMPDLLLRRYRQEQSGLHRDAPPPAAAAPDTRAKPAIPEPAPEQTSILAGGGEALKPRLIGIAFDTYWIFQADDRLLLVDQHAAHERILYDRLMKRMEGEQISQPLLSPQLVQLTQRDMALAEELSQPLLDAGFQVERFDDSNVAVHAIPTLFGENESPRELFLEALDEWQAGRGQPTGERMRKQVAQMACKHAIKGGDRLSDDEIQGFMNEMLKSAAMPTCPHGRPIVTELTRYELEKRFKRIQ